jgi:hypothetical protein
MIITPKAFLGLGLHVGYQQQLMQGVLLPLVTSRVTRQKRFRSLFGVSSDVCSHVWEYAFVNATIPAKAKPEHLLWCLLFMKTYDSEAVLSTVVGVSEKTFRLWVWRLLEAISLLYDKIVSFIDDFFNSIAHHLYFQIIFENRLIADFENRWCRMTVDGTDFAINEPTPFSSRWYSHKFRGPGLRYEVGVSIKGGDIVHTNGPFPCGSWPDITIFRSCLMDKLDDGEMVEADRGYRGQPNKVRIPVDCRDENERKKKNRARARHETVNKRFKQFGILKQKFRHNLRKHQQIFRSVVVLTQLAIESGEVLFAVDFE